MSKHNIKKYIYKLGVLPTAILLLSTIVARSAFAQTVTQGYGANQTLQRGMIVGIIKNDPTKVEPLKSDDEKRMHGVIVDANDAPVTLSSESQKVFVANVGRYSVLVSNQNGVISPGDYIAISALQGVGMKAGANQSTVLGKAIEGFDGKSQVVSTANIKDSTGSDKKISMNRILVDLSIGANPLARSEANVPEFLRKAAESVANKPVSATKAYLSILVLFGSIGIASAVLYSGVKSSLLSIGRNPLSKKSILRGLLQIILTGLIIFIIGVFGVYLLLRL